MKKLLLLAFILTACQTTTVDSDPCAAPDGTYVASHTEEWEGIEFQLPWCWTMDDSWGQLMLKDGGGENFVQISTSEFEIVEGPTIELTKTAPDGTMLYISVYDSEDSQVQLILDSIEWMETPQGPEVLNNSSTACDALDTTYPQLTYETWNGIKYGRPWCWYDVIGTEGSTDGILRMEHGEGDAWVEFSIPTGIYDGPSDGYMESIEEDYHLLNFGGEFLLKTDNPNHTDVQNIIYSITLP